MTTPTPTNIITGFLGVGKTTAIQHLLSLKPAHERWAILVNEFGEIGIDGSMLSGSHQEQAGVFIREVPGGCMCCTAGLPMQMALNMLLTRARPDRLLIEPTGLGHPHEVLASLSAPHYQELLSLHATVTLIDARQIREGEFSKHPTFRDQVDVADVIIASKADLYQPDDLPALLNYLSSRGTLSNKPVYPVENGRVELDWLAAATAYTPGDSGDFPAQAADASAEPARPELSEQGYLCMANSGEGFFSRGWIFDSTWVFDATRLHSLLTGFETDRAKGVFVTNEGVAAFNKADGVLKKIELDECLDSRIECIGRDERALEGLESALLECVVSR